MENTIYICFPSFEKDLKHANEKWIKEFSNYLEKLLNRLVTGSFKVLICEDFKIDRNHTLNSLFDDKDKNPLLVLPVSSEIINNKGFKEILNRIDEKNKRNSEYMLSRVYKVLMSPVSEKEQTDILKKLSSYILYSDNDINNLPFAPKQTAWQKLIDLAYDISSSLMSEDVKESTERSPAEKTAVFLAESTPDQGSSRDNVKRELIQSGYKVFPENPLPNSTEHAKEIIKRSLEQSELSIHIVGNEYGEKMIDSDVSLMNYQLDIALGNDTDQDLDKIIWLPPDLDPESDFHNQYIDKLRKTALSGKSSEVIQAPIEVLKTMVRKRLSRTISHAGTETKTAIPEGRFIYMIHEPDYISDVKKITSGFQEENIQFVDSNLLKSVKNPVKWHRENLVACDGFIIYYPRNNAPWINSKLTDIVKAPGYGRKKPFSGKIVLAGDKFQDSLINIANVDIVEMKNNFQQNIINTFR